MELRYCEQCGDILELENAGESMPLEGYVCGKCGGDEVGGTARHSERVVESSSVAEPPQTDRGREDEDHRTPSSQPTAPGSVFDSEQLQLFSNESLRIHKEQLQHLRKSAEPSGSDSRNVSIADTTQREGVDTSKNGGAKVAEVAEVESLDRASPSAPRSSSSSVVRKASPAASRGSARAAPRSKSRGGTKAPSAATRKSPPKTSSDPKRGSGVQSPGSSMDFDTSFFDRMEETQPLGSQVPASRAQKIIFRCPHCRSALSIRPVTSTSRLECPTCTQSVYVTMSGQAFDRPPSIVMRDQRRQQSDEAAYDVPRDESGMYDSSIDSGMYDSSFDSDMYDPELDLESPAGEAHPGSHNSTPGAEEEARKRKRDAESAARMMSAGLRTSNPLDREPEHEKGCAPVSPSNSGDISSGLLRERVYDDDPEEKKAAAKAEARPAAVSAPRRGTSTTPPSPVREQKVATVKPKPPAQPGAGSQMAFSANPSAGADINEVRFESRVIRKARAAKSNGGSVRVARKAGPARAGGMAAVSARSSRRPSRSVAQGLPAVAAGGESEGSLDGDSLAQRAAAARRKRAQELPRESIARGAGLAAVLALVLGAPVLVVGFLGQSKTPARTGPENTVRQGDQDDAVGPTGATSKLTSSVGEAMSRGIEEIRVRVGTQSKVARKSSPATASDSTRLGSGQAGASAPTAPSPRQGPVASSVEGRSPRWTPPVAEESDETPDVWKAPDVAIEPADRVVSEGKTD